MEERKLEMSVEERWGAGQGYRPARTKWVKVGSSPIGEDDRSGHRGPSVRIVKNKGIARIQEYTEKGDSCQLHMKAVPAAEVTQKASNSIPTGVSDGPKAGWNCEGS
jgi:hypothetical protein